MAKKATTPTPKELMRTANTVATPEERRKAIHGALQMEATTGYFGAVFNRLEYPDTDFMHLTDAGFCVCYVDKQTLVLWDKELD